MALLSEKRFTVKHDKLLLATVERILKQSSKRVIDWQHVAESIMLQGFTKQQLQQRYDNLKKKGIRTEADYMAYLLEPNKRKWIKNHKKHRSSYTSEMEKPNQPEESIPDQEKLVQFTEGSIQKEIHDDRNSEIIYVPCRSLHLLAKNIKVAINNVSLVTLLSDQLYECICGATEITRTQFDHLRDAILAGVDHKTTKRLQSQSCTISESQIEMELEKLKKLSTNLPVSGFIGDSFHIEARESKDNLSQPYIMTRVHDNEIHEEYKGSCLKLTEDVLSLNQTTSDEKYLAGVKNVKGRVESIQCTTTNLKPNTLEECLQHSEASDVILLRSKEEKWLPVLNYICKQSPKPWVMYQKEDWEKTFNMPDVLKHTREKLTEADFYRFASTQIERIMEMNKNPEHQFREANHGVCLLLYYSLPSFTLPALWHKICNYIESGILSKEKYDAKTWTRKTLQKLLLVAPSQNFLDLKPMEYFILISQIVSDAISG